MNKSLAINRRLLPPTLMLYCLLGMLTLQLLLPGPAFFSVPAALVGGLLLIAGLILTIGGNEQFLLARTPVNPLERPQTLVTEGLYRYTRNPMYLGFALVLGGLWLMLGALTPVLGPLVFIIVIDRWYIRYEEETLTQVFGPTYLAYQRQVRRWL